MKAKYITILAIVSFLLHIVWENAQEPLFASRTSFAQHLLICLLGTIGDVIFTLLVYFGISLLKNDFEWIFRLNKRDVFVLAVIGLFFSIGIEWRALLFERWNYADAMPIIPYLGVALMPVLQMIILLPLSFYLTKNICKNLILSSLAAERAHSRRQSALTNLKQKLRL